MSDQLPVVRDPQHGLGVLAPTQIGLERLGLIFYKSGMFRDVKSASQAVVKMAAGQELGIGVFAAMQGLHVMDGKVTLGAGVIAAQIRKHPHYDFRVLEHTGETCSIEFTYKGDIVGISTFTIQDAQQAGLIKSGGGWTKFPKNMLYARAMSNGARWYCPDVFAGPIYTPDELGVEVNEQGDVIDVPVVQPRGDNDLGTPDANADGSVSEDQKLIGGGLRELLTELMGNDVDAANDWIRGEAQRIGQTTADKLNGGQMALLIEAMQAKVDELRGVTQDTPAEGAAAPGPAEPAAAPPAAAGPPTDDGEPFDAPVVVRTLAYKSASEDGVVRTVSVLDTGELTCDCPAFRYAANRPCKHVLQAAKDLEGQTASGPADEGPVDVPAEAVTSAASTGTGAPQGDEIDRMGTLISIATSEDVGLSTEDAMRVIGAVTGGDMAKLLDSAVYSQCESAIVIAGGKPKAAA